MRILNGIPQITSPLVCASVRDVPIPADVVTTLGEHRRRQRDQRRAAGAAWADHGLVFCRADGTLLAPSDLERDFARWIAAAGVPPIRIHDLRHVHLVLTWDAREPKR